MTQTDPIRKGTSGAIASENHLASEIGAAILARGGNAVDAAIATSIAVHTTSPHHSCVGGGGFALLRTPEGEYRTLNFRHTAPAAATMEYFTEDPARWPASGGAAVAVPSELRGFALMHAEYGRLPWSDLFAPSIELAKGMPFSRDLYSALEEQCPNAPSIEGSWIASDPEYVKTYTRDGRLIPAGEQYARPDYARTLELAASKGPDGVYSGEIAQRIVDAVRARGGVMTVEDFESCSKPEWTDPISAPYANHRIYTPRAPASGAVLLAALGAMDHLDLKAGPQDPVAAHRTIEAMRHAYAGRHALGDPHFVDGLDEVQAAWITPEACRARADKVLDGKTFPPEYYERDGPTTPATDNGTSNITTADASGMIVTLTTTIGSFFGSHVLVPGTGIHLNDSVNDFSVKGRNNWTGYAPAPANYVSALRRPLSSSTPYIIETLPSPGSPARAVVAGGAAGGSTIPSACIQVIRNVLVYGHGALDSLAASRVHDQTLPDETVLERPSDRAAKVVGYSEAEARVVEGYGHKISWVPASRSTPVVLCIRPDGSYDAAGDPRKYEAGGAGGAVYYA